MNAGLRLLRHVDQILAWLVAEDDGAKGKIREGLEVDGLGFEAIKETLMDFIDYVKIDSGDFNGDQREWDERTGLGEILGTLMGFLE